MRVHIYYIVTVILAALLGLFVLGVIFSEEILLKDDFKRGDSLISNSQPSSAVVATDSLIRPIKGVDVSHFQGDVPWDKLDTSILFAICKATEGHTLLDAKFKENWSTIKNSKRIRGAYHFYLTSDPPATQATFFWDTVGQLEDSDLPLILDIEEGSLRGEVTIYQLQKDLLTFLTNLERVSGKRPIIYSNTFFANKYLDNQELAAYPLWVAEYSSSRTTPELPSAWKNKGWVFWQKSDTYNLQNANEDVDFDLFNGTKEHLKAFILESNSSL